MKRIIFIGGGEIGDYETLPFDEHIVKSAGKDHPNLLFIPTASFDALGYVDLIQQVYGEKLGCNVTSLLLMSADMTSSIAHEKISSVDIIYVGGGSTRNLMAYWKQYNVDQFLLEAYHNGTILSGISAGSICWFENGHSDSVTYETGVDSPYMCIDGIGILKGIHCPHYNDNRQDDFDIMVKQVGKIGIALEDFTAIEVVDDQYRVLKSREHAKVYKVYSMLDKVVREEIQSVEGFNSWDGLLRIRD